MKLFFYCVLYCQFIAGVSYLHLDPTVAQFLETIQNFAPIYTLTPPKAREVLDNLQAKSVGTIPANVEEKMIPGGTTNEVSITIVRPINAKGKLPAILYMHGGGWILGNKNTHDRLIREIANGAQAAVIFVNYSRSPEAYFPIALGQGYAALEYVAHNAHSLQIDPQLIAIAGDSVGGCMATVIARLTKERNGPKIIKQILFYPVTDDNFNTGSYKEFASGYWLSKKAMEWFWDAYLPNKKARANSDACPLKNPIEQLRGLPSALIITDENDVLRDEGEAYARKLMQAGVSVSAVRILGTIHDFVMLDPLKNTPPTRTALDLAITELKKAFYPNK